MNKKSITPKQCSLRSKNLTPGNRALVAENDRTSGTSSVSFLFVSRRADSLVVGVFADVSSNYASRASLIVVSGAPELARR